MIGHPREDVLLAFQDHRLDDRRRRRLAGHLSGCQRCRNVVQAHRTVRGVFALEAPFAPDGVLERALASRAAGMLVMLPVAEPDARKRMELPSRGFMIAMGMVLVVGVGVQVAPTAPVQRVWSAWSAMVVGWEPFAGQGSFHWQYPSPPIARGAVVTPSRVRPMRASYQWRSYGNGTVLRSNTISMELTRQAESWRLHGGWPQRYEMTAILDSALAPTSWRVVSWWGTKDQHTSEREFTILGDSLREVHSTTLGPGGTLPRFGREPYDSMLPFPNLRAPLALGEIHLFALLSGVEFGDRWVGSIQSNYSPRFRASYTGSASTYRMVREEIVTTPAGRFECWALEGLTLGREPYERLWVSKESGVVVKVSYGYGETYGSEIVLQSVTYP